MKLYAIIEGRKTQTLLQLPHAFQEQSRPSGCGPRLLPTQCLEGQEAHAVHLQEETQNHSRSARTIGAQAFGEKCRARALALRCFESGNRIRIRWEVRMLWRAGNNISGIGPLEGQRRCPSKADRARFKSLLCVVEEARISS